MLLLLKFGTDITEVLSELELIIHKVKVSTTPDGRVVDLFFITDTRLNISVHSVFGVCLCCNVVLFYW